MTVSLGAFRVLTCSVNVGYLNRLVIPHAVELKDIKAIIDLMKKNDLSVFEMEKDGFRLKLQKGPGDQPVVAAPLTLAPTATTPQAPSGAEAAGTETGGLKDIVSPMVGTFYRGASPDAA